MTKSTLTLDPGHLTLTQLRAVVTERPLLQLTPAAYVALDDASAMVTQLAQQSDSIYGINTGFGLLAHTKIDKADIALLQHNIVLSHATGVGELLDDDSVALLLALKINSLARGYSGVRRAVVDALLALYNHGVYPCIPAQGSVGASGDLAPLAHLSLPLLGVGEVRYAGNIIPATTGLAHAGLQPLTLAAKEGLALLNGTQASTALALRGLFAIADDFSAALVSGALSVDAAAGSDTPFDPRIHAVRGHRGQIDVAHAYRHLLHGSAIRQSHQTCDRVQDPYSLRCQPQVMGACLDQLRFAAHTLTIEANAVSDNPLVFVADHSILSGGNFHAEPVAMAADNLALVAAEIGALSERRIALLTDTHLSGLPPFLVHNGGINSGFMLAHVTAAALASENKSLAHPACVDSIPTSANQEDHVSMATFAARRLLAMATNTRHILAIEYLAACQGIDLRAPLHTSPLLQHAHQAIRQVSPYYDKDRYFAPEITAVAQLITQQTFHHLLPAGLLL